MEHRVSREADDQAITLALQQEDLAARLLGAAVVGSYLGSRQPGRGDEGGDFGGWFGGRGFWFDE